MMMTMLHTAGNSCNSQTLLSLNYNNKRILYHHQYSSSLWKLINMNNGRNNGNNVTWNCQAISGIGMLAAAVVLSTPAPPEDTFSNIPQELAGKSCESIDKECNKEKLKNRIQRPKSRNAESCTTKCVGTCIRGGDGSPGEGPLNVRRPIIVFKQGFRSRQYCLVECSDLCNLLDDADKGH